MHRLPSMTSVVCITTRTCKTCTTKSMQSQDRPSQFYPNTTACNDCL